MPWYKVYCDSGPGHQSHHEFYHWEEKKLTKAGKKDLWEESFQDRDWPIGDVKMVKYLPHDVKDSLILRTNERLVSVTKSSKRLLEVLVGTPAKGCDHVGYTNTYFSQPRMRIMNTCKSCGKIRFYGGKWMKKPSEKKILQLAEF